MKNNKAKIFGIIAALAFVGVIVLIILFNTGALGDPDYGYCIRRGNHNHWMSRGFGRRFHGGRGFGRGRYGMGFGHRDLFGGFPLGAIIIAVFLFAAIIGLYFFLRNKNNFQSNKKNTGLTCSSCGQSVEKNWTTCPYCGQKL